MLFFLRSIFGNPTREQFASWMKALYERKDKQAWDYHSDQFCLRGANGRIIGLTNLYDELRLCPRRRRPVLLWKYRKASLFPFPAEIDRDAALANALPFVRERTFFDLLPLYSGGPPFDLWRPLGRHYALSLVIDASDAFRQVGPDDLEKWGLTFDQLMAEARGNLQKRSDPARFLLLGAGLYLAGWNDCFDACRLVLQGLVRQLELPGDPVVFLPNRNNLLVTSDADPAALAAAFAVVGQILEKEPRPMSARPLRLRGLEWEDLALPADHPARPDLDRAHRQAEVRDYQEQQACLNRLLEERGEDVFVASARLFQGPDGREFTLSNWVGGVDHTLLPRTDRLAFVCPTKDEAKPEVFVVDWDQAVPLVADLMEETDYHPARYRLRTFPAAETLARLREMAEQTGA